jgi:hypothetical protein
MSVTAVAQQRIPPGGKVSTTFPPQLINPIAEEVGKDLDPFGALPWCPGVAQGKVLLLMKKHLRMVAF